MLSIFKDQPVLGLLSRTPSAQLLKWKAQILIDYVSCQAVLAALTYAYAYVSVDSLHWIIFFSFFFF